MIRKCIHLHRLYHVNHIYSATYHKCSIIKLINKNNINKINKEYDDDNDYDDNNDDQEEEEIDIEKYKHGRGGNERKGYSKLIYIIILLLLL